MVEKSLKSGLKWDARRGLNVQISVTYLKPLNLRSMRLMYWSQAVIFPYSYGEFVLFDCCQQNTKISFCFCFIFYLLIPICIV